MQSILDATKKNKQINENFSFLFFKISNTEREIKKGMTN